MYEIESWMLTTFSQNWIFVPHNNLKHKSCDVTFKENDIKQRPSEMYFETALFGKLSFHGICFKNIED